MATILITGGTGLVGSALSKLLLENGHAVLILSRHAPLVQAASVNSDGRPAMALWDINSQTIDADAIRRADYIVHLAGAGVADERWTKKRKKEIVESRTKSSTLIIKALREIPNHVKAVICASAIGWYSPVDSESSQRPAMETDPPDGGFLGETCRLWEASIDPVTDMGKRLVKLRTGIVLSKDGGALSSFKKPIRWGICPILGNGRQIISWIHIDDLCRIYWQAILDESWQGVYNAVAPRPVDNKKFTIELAKKMKGKFFIPVYVPAFLLKLFLGEMSTEVLKSANISAAKIKNTGFQFIYPSIEAAITNDANER